MDYIKDRDTPYTTTHRNNKRTEVLHKGQRDYIKGPRGYNRRTEVLHKGQTGYNKKDRSIT